MIAKQRVGGPIDRLVELDIDAQVGFGGAEEGGEGVVVQALIARRYLARHD